MLGGDEIKVWEKKRRKKNNVIGGKKSRGRICRKGSKKEMIRNGIKEGRKNEEGGLEKRKGRKKIEVKGGWIESNEKWRDDRIERLIKKRRNGIIIKIENIEDKEKIKYIIKKELEIYEVEILLNFKKRKEYEEDWENEKCLSN